MLLLNGRFLDDERWMWMGGDRHLDAKRQCPGRTGRMARRESDHHRSLEASREPLDDVAGGQGVGAGLFRSAWSGFVAPAHLPEHERDRTRKDPALDQLRQHAIE